VPATGKIGTSNSGGTPGDLRERRRLDFHGRARFTTAKKESRAGDPEHSALRHCPEPHMSSAALDHDRDRTPAAFLHDGIEV